MAYCPYCRARLNKTQKHICKGLRAAGVKAPISPQESASDGTNLFVLTLAAIALFGDSQSGSGDQDVSFGSGSYDSGSDGGSSRGSDGGGGGGGD